ncbi:MAG: type III polyketide synthase [Verrucomicrobia bacterium]|nr:MAG: type III polyketide synthase [Verrucomicrobiota bacterium]
MSAHIHSIATAVPPLRYRQEQIRDFMLQAVPGDERMRRVLRRMYAQSGIAFRHSVLGDLKGAVAEPFFVQTLDLQWHTPTTAQRNARFTREAPPLFVDIARRALAQSDFAPSEVTHVVTASCTGFFNPGPDFHIVRALGLPETTHRVHVGFMGCYAMFPALKVAEAFCRADANAVVLVVCVELCSLHIQLKPTGDSLLAGCLFADGGGGAVVSAKSPRIKTPTLAIQTLETTLLPDSAAAMAWTIGDDGFDIVLSSYVPDIIRAHIQPAVERVLAKQSLTLCNVSRWAVHPGGRAILDKVATALALPADACDVSREVLRDYGNMSGATLFFVLERILHGNAQPSGATLCALAFGPGLTLEMGLFTRNGGGA